MIDREKVYLVQRYDGEIIIATPEMNVDGFHYGWRDFDNILHCVWDDDMYILLPNEGWQTIGDNFPS